MILEEGFEIGRVGGRDQKNIFPIDWTVPLFIR